MNDILNTMIGARGTDEIGASRRRQDRNNDGGTLDAVQQRGLADTLAWTRANYGSVEAQLWIRRSIPEPSSRL
jgi:hypothetical protein